jgi:hypothetical protein
MSDISNELLHAIELAESGDWETAHRLAQEHEGEAMADWIHALLHKIEGDSSNSRYWYDRAGKPEWFSRKPETEWSEIRKCLVEDCGGHCE